MSADFVIEAEKENVNQADWLEIQMRSVLVDSVNALVLSNIPRQMDSSDLILELYDAGFRPILDFDFLHVPMSPSTTNQSCGVINLIDVSTRNAFISCFQG